MTWVIAHRGASAGERENTLPAFGDRPALLRETLAGTDETVPRSRNPSQL